MLLKNKISVSIFSILSVFFFSCSGEKTTLLSFDFKYEVIFNELGTVEAWIPVPQMGPFQIIDNLFVSTTHQYRMENDSIFGNLFLHLTPFELTDTDTLTVYFRVHRQEARPHAIYTEATTRELYLQPYKKVPLNPQLYSIAEALSGTGGDKIKEIYNTIIKHMEYDKSGDGWGQGDAVYACKVGKGNCTDYHSLFNALLRVQQTPAQFNIGFSIPKGLSGEVIGYHCWTEFYHEGGGWFPVDISEADKHPDQEDYYFGKLDNRRVKFTVGRDIPLPGGTATDIVNFSVYPYVKVNGVSSRGFIPHFFYEVVN